MGTDEFVLVVVAALLATSNSPKVNLYIYAADESNGMGQKYNEMIYRTAVSKQRFPLEAGKVPLQ